jgi:hypothetical protein
MPTKKELKDYITTVKPSAEVKFSSTNGEVTESVASRTYVAKPVDKKIAPMSQGQKLNDRLNKVIETAEVNADLDAQADLDALEAEVDAEEMLDESANTEFVKTRDEGDGAESPMTYVPNAQHEAASTAELSETAMMIKLLSMLIDKVDAMQNFNPVIHVPAPVIHVTLPETKRTVTKAVERDENNWIKTVREHIEETPVGEPLIEVKQNSKEPIREDETNVSPLSKFTTPKAKAKAKKKENK